MKRILFSLLVVTALSLYGVRVVFAQSDAPIAPGNGNNQVVSRDAIGLRIVPNPEHLSPLQWYNKNIKVKGSPQSLIVDGYEAVRDGRSVYVNAAKLVQVSRCATNPSIICQNDSQCGQNNQNETLLPIKSVFAAGECQVSATPEIYTNIYIISYNQSPESATTDIFGQLLQYWKFNIEVKNCSATTAQSCKENSDCPRAEVCQQTGSCSIHKESACIIDADCPQGEFCSSKKSAVIRDTKRLSDVRDMKDRLEAYNGIVHRYPSIENGSYLTNRTVSTWPSWGGTFGATLGSAVPNDPINVLGACSGYEALTCWNDQTKQFAGTPDPLALPSGSRAYYYQYKPSDNSFSFCALTESGYVQAKGPTTPYCRTGRNCIRSCSGKQCGSDGCGGSCGNCNSGQTCQNGTCRINAPIGND